MDLKIKTELQSILREYGLLSVEYYGEGNISFENEQSFHCNFGIGQILSGQNYFVANLIERKTVSFPEILDQKFTFSGRSEDRVSISCKSKGLGISMQFFNVVYSINSFNIDYENKKPIKKISFGLTNFLFTGNSNRRNYLLLTIPKCEQVIIQKKENYDDIITQLKDKISIDVTSELTIQTNEEISISNVIEIASKICFLLAISRGTKIFWIYYKCYDENGDIICQNHSNTITRPVSALPEIIPSDIWGIEATKKFLECSYATILDNSFLMNTLPSLSNIFTDAREGKGFIQVQGIKVVVLMEMLGKYVLEDPRFHTQEFILNETDEELLFAEIKKVIKDNISSPEVRAGLYNNIRSLNRTSFRILITNLCKNINLHLNDLDVLLFIKSRNSLIHTGKYYCETVTEKEKKQLPPLESRFVEYLFLINFLDKIFLKLFNYSGEYNNIRKDWKSKLDDEI